MTEAAVLRHGYRVARVSRLGFIEDIRSAYLLARVKPNEPTETPDPEEQST